MSIVDKPGTAKRYWLCTIIVAVLSAPVAASEGAVINLKDAVERTLQDNPNLVSFGYQIEAQQGRLIQSRLRPNPELGILVENVLGSGDFNKSDDAEATLSLSWLLERGKRDQRVVVATAGVSLIESEAEIRRLDEVAETARLFLDILANQERLVRTQNSVSLAKQTVKAIGERVRAGRTPEADLARAEAQLARTLLLQEDFEHELKIVKHRLAAQWGESQLDFVSATGNISQLPVLASFTEILNRVDENPDFLRFASERRLRESELAMAEAEAKPSWQLTTGIRRFQESGDQALLFGVTIPLARHNRNQGGVAEAQAKLSMTSANQSAARIRIETQLFALYQELLHSMHRATVLREEVLPKVEQALAETQRAYANGRYGYFEYQIVQQEVLDAQSALIETSINAHKRLIEIERLTGTSLLSLEVKK
ncbi:MAG: cobalt-zinc-cadmium efflux system outer membrane protein [Candidatus Azotimanducaceae bacterium]|jgi:cobalt-zinc-cadmium efflux system outer membrane protein